MVHKGFEASHQAAACPVENSVEVAPLVTVAAALWAVDSRAWVVELVRQLPFLP